MYNRCNGVSGRVERVREKGDIKIPQRPQKREAPGTAAPRQIAANSAPQRRKPGLSEQLGGLIPRIVGELETEDIILLLILYLMYRDSGDKELLIIMGAMFLL